MAMRKLPVALQLFTVYKAFEEQPVETLKAVAKMGYQGVELIWSTGGMTHKELRGVIEGEGMNPISAHIPIQVWEAEGEGFADKLADLGVKYTAVPWLPEDMRPGKPGYAKTIEWIKKIGTWLSPRGIQPLYHNHEFEFVRIDGEYALDRLYREIPELMAELDIYWIKFSGECPAEYIRKYATRLPILHLKDMEDTPERSFTEVGNGTQDLPAIFEAADKAGVKWYVVEQDTSRIGALESARISRENLAKLGI